MIKILVCFVYLVTMPFVFVSRLTEWCKNNTDHLGIMAYVAGCMMLILYVFRVSEDKGNALLVIILGVYLGFFPFLAVAIRLALTLMITCTYLFSLPGTAINRVCRKYRDAYFKTCDQKDTYDDTREYSSYHGYDQNRRSDRSQQESFFGSAVFTDRNLATAIDMYEMQTGYTVDQLRHRRRDLMKKNHPDEGGSNSFAQKINEAYDILVKYAAAS